MRMDKSNQSTTNHAIISHYSFLLRVLDGTLNHVASVALAHAIAVIVSAAAVGAITAGEAGTCTAIA